MSMQATATSKSAASGPNRLEIPVLLGVVVFGYCYFGVVATLIQVWSQNSVFSYGFAVPFISGYVAWSKSEEWRGLRWVPDYSFGVPVVLCAAALLAVGRIGGLVTFQGLSLVVAVAGLVLLFCGRRTFRVLAFPIAYLLLMVPIWHDPIGRIQVPSQLVSARIAVELLHAVGVPASRQGTTIVLPALTLDVLRECSGVNQLVALLAMVIPAAYLWLSGWFRRILLIGIAVVVGYLSNGLRIALLGWLAVNGFSDGDRQGMPHLLHGLGVSIVGYVAIGACLTLLSKTSRNRSLDSARVVRTSSEVTDSAMRTLRRHWVEYAVLVVMLVAASPSVLTAGSDVQLADSLHALPARIGDWTVDSSDPAVERLVELDSEFVRAYPGSQIRRFASVDDQLLRTYRSPRGTQVELYIGYYRRQEQGKEFASDAGHALDGVASRAQIQLQTGTIELGQVVLSKSDSDRGLLFWYDVNGRVVRNLYSAKMYTLWDALSRRRTNGAVVMVGWTGPKGAQFNAARTEVLGFVEALVPTLRRQLPS
jgi:EpsI family protein